jgi:hypothetical protein
VKPTYSDKAIEKAVNTVNMAFLVHVFAIMQEPIDRQTATEYWAASAKPCCCRRRT